MMNERRAADALVAMLWVLRDLIVRDVGDNANLTDAVKEALDAAARAEMGGNVAGHLPEVTAKIERVDSLSYQYDLKHLTHKALHAVMVALSAVEAAVAARAAA